MSAIPERRTEYKAFEYDGPSDLARRLTELSAQGWVVSPLDPGYLPDELVMMQRTIKRTDKDRVDQALEPAWNGSEIDLGKEFVLGEVTWLEPNSQSDGPIVHKLSGDAALRALVSRILEVQG